MICPQCRSELAEASAFCSNCGTNLSADNSHSFGITKNTIRGNIQQAGRDINNYNLKEYTDSPYPEVKATPVWRSNVTQATLTWMSFFTGIGSLGSLTPIFKDVIELISGKVSFSVHAPKAYVPWFIGFAVLAILWALTWRLKQITKFETRHPLIFNLAISGAHKKLSIEKISAVCPICGGNMRYFNAPYDWIDWFYTDGRRKREVTKRVPALECRRNRDHCFRVDIAIG